VNVFSQPTVLKHIFPFLTWLPLLNRATLQADLMAGITGAIIVLPQGVAYAMIAGLPPEYGLYAAMIPAIIAGLFGSSWHLISGPTVAMSIVIFTALSPIAEVGSPEFIQLALTLTFLAGVFQFALGLARLGALVNFVSHSVVIGFTAGAAVLIGTSQLKNALGVSIHAESFIETWHQLINALPQTNLYALSVAIITLIVSILFKRFYPKLPGMLFAMIIGGLTAIILGSETHHIKLVGALPSQLPPLSFPELSLENIKLLASSALAIAMLGLVEAVSIARSVSTRSRQIIDGNQEFIGQGLSNIIGAFFSGYAASGSFTRTGVNYEAGAKTPMAAVFAGIVLALIVLLIAPLTAYVPIPSMAGILLVVSFNLIDFHHIKTIIKSSNSETSVLIVTFLSTLFLELEFAIYVGVMLSLVIYLNRTSKPRIVTLAPDIDDVNRRLSNIANKPSLQQCPQCKIIRIDGSLFFGAASYTAKKLQDIEEPYVLIESSGINFVDVAGAEMLAQEAERRKEKGGGLYFARLKSPNFNILERGGYLKTLSEKNFFETKTEAIQWAFIHLNKEICQTCTARIFNECASVK
jgi:sulfate permease, SulP family